MVRFLPGWGSGSAALALDLALVFGDHRSDRVSDGTPRAQTEVIVDRGGGHRLEFFDERQAAGVVAGAFEAAEFGGGFEQRAAEGALGRADSGRPGGEAVDGAVEVVQPDVDAAGIVADDLVGDRLKFVVPDHDMVAVPAHRTADMEQDLVEEEQRRTDLVADGLGRVEVAGVEAEQDLLPLGVAHVELVRADGAAFDPDAEELALDRVAHLFKVSFKVLIYLIRNLL